MQPEPATAVGELIRRTRLDRGLPATIHDEAVIDRVGQILANGRSVSRATRPAA